MRNSRFLQDLEFPESPLGDFLTDMRASNTESARSNQKKPSLLNFSALTNSSTPRTAYTPATMESPRSNDTSDRQRLLPSRFMSRGSGQQEPVALPPLADLLGEPKHEETTTTISDSSSTIPPKAKPQPKPEKKPEPIRHFGIEDVISDTLDYAHSDFIRLFKNEFVALMKPIPTPLIPNEVAKFTNDVIQMIRDELHQPIVSTPIDVMTANCANVVAKELRETIEYTLKGLREKQQRDKKEDVKYFEDMKTLQTVIDELTSKVKSVRTEEITALNRERIETAIVRDNAVSTSRSLEMRERELRLLSLELAAKMTKLKSELERINVETSRVEGELSRVRSELRPPATPLQFMSTSTLAKRIDQIIDVIQEDHYTSLSTQIEHLDKDITQTTDTLREEVKECEIASQKLANLATGRKRLACFQKHRENLQICPKPSLADAAKAKLNELRHRRDAVETDSLIRLREHT